MRMPAVALVLLCAACSSSGASAQSAPKNPATTAAKPAPAPAAPQPLSQEQIAKIQQLRLDAIGRAAPARAQMQVKRAQIQAMWQKPQPSREQILKAEAEIDALRQQVHQIWVELRLAALAVLTPEQRAAGMTPGPGPGSAPGFGPGLGRGPGGWGGRGMGRGMGRGPGMMGGGQCPWAPGS